MPPCGKNGRDVPGSYQAMAGMHIESLRANRRRGPFLLGGTCNGGLVAYEMARQLLAGGQRVNLLLLIGSSASNLRFRAMRRLIKPLRSLLPGGGAELESRISGGVARLHRSWDKLRSLPPAHVPRFIWNRTPKAAELVNYLLKRNGKGHGTSKLYHKYQRIDQEYIPDRYDGKITLFWSDDEPENATEAARWWRKIAAEVEVPLLPASPHQEALARHGEVVGAMIRTCIEAAGRS
jgi:thioesterase domain-containing protein